MKISNTNPLFKMYKESRKITDEEVKLIGNSSYKKEYKFYFKVKENEIFVMIYKKKGVVPYIKEFNCSCEHGSLFGKNENVPCKHIIKLLIWLDKNLENQNDNNKRN